MLQHVRYLCDSNSPDMDKRCGDGLRNEYMSSAIQHMLNNVPSRELRATKHIFQPGTLHKHSAPARPLKLVPLCVVGFQHCTIEALQMEPVMDRHM